MKDIEKRPSSDWEGFRNPNLQSLAEQMIAARESRFNRYEPRYETFLVIAEKAKQILLDESSNGLDRDLARRIVETGVNEMYEMKNHIEAWGKDPEKIFDIFMERAPLSAEDFIAMRAYTAHTLETLRSRLREWEATEARIHATNDADERSELYNKLKGQKESWQLRIKMVEAELRALDTEIH